MWAGFGRTQGSSHARNQDRGPRTVKRGGKYSRYLAPRQLVQMRQMRAGCAPCQASGKGEGGPSTAVHFPVAFPLVPHLQQPVARVMPLATGRTHQKPAPLAALAVIILRNREGGAATAGNQMHPGQRRASFELSPRLFHDYVLSSTAMSALFFRLFDCKIFLRIRRDLGVISTYSSSAMNSIACSRSRFR